jgi:hypothetical protein
MRVAAGDYVDSNAVDLYNSLTGRWSTAQLSVRRRHIAATSVGNLAIFAGGTAVGSDYLNVVDLYNIASGTWSTAQLSVARWGLAATSVGNLAIFAGGSGNCSFAMCDGGFVLVLLCVFEAFRLLLAFCLRCRRLPSDERHCRSIRCCGLVQRCIGNMVDCSAQRRAQ